MFALCLAVGLSVAPSSMVAETVRRGDHFEVVCHFEGEAIAGAMLEAVEALWPYAVDLYGVDEGALDDPLRVHLYRSTSDYERAEAKLTRGEFRKNLAFAHWDTRSAHVSVQPEVDDDLLAEVGVQRLLEEGRMPDPRAVFADQVAELAFYDRYSMQEVFFRFLKEGAFAEQLDSILAEARSLGGGGDYTSRLLTAIDDIIGKSKYARLEKAFAKYVRAQDAQWDTQYRSLEHTEAGWLQIAFTDRNAVCWRTTPMKKSTYRAKGRLRILPGGHGQLNLLLGREGNDFISVAFNAGYGVTVFDYRSQGNRWNRLGAAEVGGMEVGADVEFEVAVRKKRITVSIAGKEVLQVEVEGRDLSGPWGLGAQAACAGLWREIAVK